MSVKFRKLSLNQSSADTVVFTACTKFSRWNRWKHLCQHICVCQHNSLQQPQCHLPQTTHTPSITVPTNVIYHKLRIHLVLRYQPMSSTTTTHTPSIMVPTNVIYHYYTYTLYYGTNQCHLPLLHIHLVLRYQPMSSTTTTHTPSITVPTNVIYHYYTYT